jgi:hypothetical protein
MNAKFAAAALALVLPLAPPIAYAQVHQGEINNQIQSAINQQMVRNGIEQSLQNQLQQQQSALQTQQRLLQLQMQNNLTQGAATLQQLEVQQQLLLIQAEIRAYGKKKTPKKHTP